MNAKRVARIIWSLGGTIWLVVSFGKPDFATVAMLCGILHALNNIADAVEDKQ